MRGRSASVRIVPDPPLPAEAMFESSFTRMIISLKCRARTHYHISVYKQWNQVKADSTFKERECNGSNYPLTGGSGRVCECAPHRAGHHRWPVRVLHPGAP